METPAAALARAAVDLAIIGVMADGGLRRSEAAALAWGDVEFWLDGDGPPHGPEGQESAGPGDSGTHRDHRPRPVGSNRRNGSRPLRQYR